jgi:hypothetical protein
MAADTRFMPNLTAGTTAVPLPAVRGPVTVQNLGPGTVYYDADPAVTTGTGVRLSVGEIRQLSIAAVGALYLISSQASTDVRYLAAG